MRLDDLLQNAEDLRARGVLRVKYMPAPGQQGEAGFEIDLAPLAPPSVEPKGLPNQPSVHEAREQARRRNLEDEFRHVGGPPPWLARQEPEEVVVPDPGDGE